MRVILPWAAVIHDNHRLIAIRVGRKARLIASPEYREKKEVAETLLCAQWHHTPKLEGELTLHALCFFPDRRKRDSGNYRKLITDSLSGIAYADDSQLVSETWEKAGISKDNPRIEITLEEKAAWQTLAAPSRVSEREPTPDSAMPRGFVEAQDLLSLIRLAAMDGYNKQPVCTVDDWVEECKKRVFLLCLAASPVSPSLSTSSPELTKMLDRLRPHVYSCDCAFCANFAAARRAIELSFATLTEELNTANDELNRVSAMVGQYQEGIAKLGAIVGSNAHVTPEGASPGGTK